MGEKETAGNASGRLAGPAGGAEPAGIAIGDQGTVEPTHGGGGGGGNPTPHGPLFPQGGGMPTHPGSGEPGGTLPGPEPDGAATTIVKSKSNITNN